MSGKIENSHAVTPVATDKFIEQPKCLTFYLVPKKSKKIYDYNKDDGHTTKEIKLSEGEPLALMSYSRSSDIYQAYYETLNPVYAGDEDKYTDLTYKDAKRVCDEFEKEIKDIEERLRIDYKMLKEGGYSSELWDDIHSMETHLKEQKEVLEEMKFISNLVYYCENEYCDFEKVLINID